MASVAQVLLEASQEMTAATNKIASILNTFDQIIADQGARINKLEEAAGKDKKASDLKKGKK